MSPEDDALCQQHISMQPHYLAPQLFCRQLHLTENQPLAKQRSVDVLTALFNLGLTDPLGTARPQGPGRTRGCRPPEGFWRTAVRLATNLQAMTAGTRSCPSRTSEPILEHEAIAGLQANRRYRKPAAPGSAVCCTRRQAGAARRFTGSPTFG